MNLANQLIMWLENTLFKENQGSFQPSHKQFFDMIIQVAITLDKQVKTLLIKKIWRPPMLSELTLMIFYMKLTHLGLEASIYINIIHVIHIFHRLKNINNIGFLKNFSYFYSQGTLSRIVSICKNTEELQFQESRKITKGNFFLDSVGSSIYGHIISNANESISDFLQMTNQETFFFVISFISSVLNYLMKNSEYRKK